MALQLVLGGSGQGKSTVLYRTITEEALANSDKHYLVIVPEQFTMQTQKDLVKINPRGGILNVDVLSFLRLAYRVFSELGVKNRPVLDDLGKVMILRKVLASQEKNLNYFRKNIGKSGYISEIKSFLSEMYQYDIQEDDMERMLSCAADKPLLHEKLKDMQIIFRSFKEYLSENYITEEEILDVLCNLVEQSDMLKGSTVCFDGFTGFTPVQYKLLSRLLEICDKVYVSITIGGDEPLLTKTDEFQLFSLSKKTIQKLYALARERGVSIEKEIYPPLQDGALYRFMDSEELGTLEKNLFRRSRAQRKGVPRDISIHVASQPRGEVHTVALQIKELLEQGYGYGEIGVVTGDINIYGRYIEEIFTKAGFPFFLDQKRNILSNPLVELVSCLLDIAISDFSYESMAQYMKSPFTDIEQEEADLLENYILAKGFRGHKKWMETWEGSKRNRKWNPETVEQIDLCRGKIMKRLNPFYEGIKAAKTVLQKCEFIYNHMVEEKLWEKLQIKKERLEADGELIRAKEYEQIYGIVIEVLDRLAELLGNEKVSIKEYRELLETGFSEARLGLIPPVSGQVVVGDMQRTRLAHIKVLFVLGANDGCIPGTHLSGGILSDADRTLLKTEVELAPTVREQIGTEQFYLYLNLTKPSGKLYISCSRIGQDGKELRPSYLYGKLQKIFPDLEMETGQEPGMAYEKILGMDLGQEYFIQGLKEQELEGTSSAWKELYRQYLQADSTEIPLERMIQGACYERVRSGLSREAALQLYGKELRGSISRLECYATCPFKHFMSYGLRLQEREKAQIAAPDFGSFIHEALERYGKVLEERKLKWYEPEEGLRRELVGQVIAETGKQFRDGLFQNSFRQQYMLKRMARVVDRTVWALGEQLRKGKYADQCISHYEINFAYEGHPAEEDNPAVYSSQKARIPIGEEEALLIHGIIDRLEVYEIDGRHYVKIVDYKTGAHKFDIKQFYYGLQLQLVVYLQNALELQRNRMATDIEPAGIFYYNISDPVLQEKQVDEEKVLRELRLEGVFSDENNVTALLDSQFERDEQGNLPASSKSLVVKMATKKDGSFDSYTEAVSGEILRNFMVFAEDKMKQMGKEILDGNTAARPYVYRENEKKNGCNYCPYESVCGIHMDTGNEEQRILDLDKEEIMQLFQNRDEKQ